MSKSLIEHLKQHLELTFSMLMNEIDACPDSLWDRKAGGFVFWQQVLHALTGAEFWTRSVAGPFQEPFVERKVYPELEWEPEGTITKEELREYGHRVQAQLETFFAQKNDRWLSEANVIYDKLPNIDVILGQIRHIQYHVGHCDSCLRERNLPTVPWRDTID